MALTPSVTFSGRAPEKMDLFDPACLRSYLLGLTDDDKRAIQALSYKHPNGFVKVVLRRNTEDGSLFRIHYWLGDLAMDQNYHNHGWAFTSKILKGGIEDTHYRKQEAEEGEYGSVFEYTFDLTKTDNKLHVTRSERVYEMVPVKASRYQEGDMYHVDPDVVHKAMPTSEDTITLVKQEPVSRPTCTVYSLTESIQDGHHYENVTMEELECILSKTLSCVPEQPRPRFKHSLFFRTQNATWDSDMKIGEILSYPDSDGMRIAAELTIHAITDLSDYRLLPYITFSWHRDFGDNLLRLIQHLNKHEKVALVYLNSAGKLGALYPDENVEWGLKCALVPSLLEDSFCVMSL